LYAVVLNSSDSYKQGKYSVPIKKLLDARTQVKEILALSGFDVLLKEAL
jgi:lysyl-tRNA synthetase class I